LPDRLLEVLIPFFQVKNPDAMMTPITVANAPLNVIRRAGETLAGKILEAAQNDPRPLIVVSSDMSHYLPHDEAVKMDCIALRALESLDTEYYFNAIRQFNISMCGI
jgi:AmmeMemoRadiSam system protein B